MPISDFDPEILQDFLTESGELLEQLESDLVQLEIDAQDLDMLNQVFRAFHTIKGNALFLDLKPLVAIVHCTEGVLNAARNKKLLITCAEMDLLLGAIDVLKVQFDELLNGSSELTEAHPTLISSLIALGVSLDDQPADGPGTRSGRAEPPTARIPCVEESTPCDVPMKHPNSMNEQTVRVEVRRLESLMELVDELVHQKNRVCALPDDLRACSIDPEVVDQLEITAAVLDRVTRDIQAEVVQARMQPLSKLFGKYPRFVRDLSKKTGKEISLVVEGADIQVDRSVIEALGDPLVHVLRNSGDHGIELPSDRVAKGKHQRGTIQIIAGFDGSRLCVQIIDDGKGLDREFIGEKAVERGLITAAQLSTLSDQEVFRFIFEAGFTTAPCVSDLSGRGVGMDVVRTNIENKLNGSLTIESIKDACTTLTIMIPLAGSIMPATIVQVAGETFAIPQADVLGIVRSTPDNRASIKDKPAIKFRGAVHPLLSAQEAFGLPGSASRGEPLVLMIEFDQMVIGLGVHGVIGQQDLVIKPLGDTAQDSLISGSTATGDGYVCRVINIAQLLRSTSNTRDECSQQPIASRSSFPSMEQ